MKERGVEQDERQLRQKKMEGLLLLLFEVVNYCRFLSLSTQMRCH